MTHPSKPADSGPPYRIKRSPTAKAQYDELQKRDRRKWRKVNKALRLLADNPKHPSLAAHRYAGEFGPSGEPIWTAYVENNTPAAWRLFYCYPAHEKGVIWIASIERHR